LRHDVTTYENDCLETSHSTEGIAHTLDQVVCNLFLGLLGAMFDRRLENHHGERYLTFESIDLANNSAFGNCRMLRHNLFDCTGGNAVASDVDHIVGTRQHVEVALIVLMASITSLVVARVLGEALLVAFFVFVEANEASEANPKMQLLYSAPSHPPHQVCALHWPTYQPGGNGNLAQISPDTPLATCSLVSRSKTFIV
jgi:hypothetical protein